MKSEDTEVRIKAMSKLNKVAAALGPQRTREQLLPYLNGESRARAAVPAPLTPLPCPFP